MVGAGYVGQRVVAKLDACPPIVLGRSSGLNLDTSQSLPVTLPAQYHVLYTVPPSPAYADDRRLANLLRMLDPLPEQFAYISTTGVYGDCAAAIVDENATIQPATDRAKRRVSAETLLGAWAIHHKRTVHILRTPAIYGPNRLGLERIREQRPIVREADAGPGNRIHVTDLVTCCLAALRSGTPGGIYNLGDGDHRSPTWFAQEVARQAGLAERPEIARVAQTESRCVATLRMRDVLGVMPLYANAEEGIRASLQA